MISPSMIRRVKARVEVVIQDLRLSDSRIANVLTAQKTAFAAAGLSLDEATTSVINTFARLKESRIDSSMHYEVFAGISRVHEPKRILEIGTSTGRFTRFLAELFPRAQIVTWDLPSASFASPSTASYRNIQIGYGDQTAQSQLRLNDIENVLQVRKDSTYLTFETGHFDVAWIDGDHTFPVVAFDIINMIRMVPKGGWICVDDIRPQNTGRGILGSQETYRTVKHLEGAGLISLHLVMKRLDNASMLLKPASPKYVAIMRRLI